jgi:NAD-dependent deacetylase
MSKPKLVALTGAGISAESGIPTFRGSDGLWEGQRVEDVASPDGWRRNPGRVLDFYNQRRRTALAVQPNAGHRILAELEQQFSVTVVTQNIDTLHEQAGSTHVIHLHGVITQARSTADPTRIYDIQGSELNLGDLCPRGSQLRPNIVWFGEAVPMIDVAAEVAAAADVFVVVGTSLLVYPAAGLIHVPAAGVPKYLIDPQLPDTGGIPNLTTIEAVASQGLARLRDLLLDPTT